MEEETDLLWAIILKETLVRL